MKIGWMTLIKLIICFYPLTAWTAPYVTVAVDTPTPYLNQALIYTVSVHSTGNIKSVEFKAPKISGASLELLAAPESTVTYHQAQPAFVTTVHYLLVPIMVGPLVIPPVSAELTLQNQTAAPNPWANPRQPYPSASMTAPKTLVLQSEATTLTILPMAPDANLWLPLAQLEMHTNLVGVRHGQQQGEILLTVNLLALSGTAKQLPSISQFINANEFKSYCQNPRFHQMITPNRQLQSQLTETCTLIPKRTGVNTINISIPWWNVTTHQTETTHWQSPLFQVSSTQFDMAQATVRPQSTTQPDTTPTLLTLKSWQVASLVVMTLLLVLSAVWAWLFQVRLNWPQPLRRYAAQASCQLMALGKLKVRCCLTAKQYDFSRVIPRVIKMKRFCCQLDQAESAAEINQVLCQYLCQNNCSTRAVNRNFLKEFNSWNSRLNPDQVSQLFTTLEAAQYGTEPLTRHELNAWKQEFYNLFSAYLFKPAPNAQNNNAQPLSRRLPTLNPVNFL